MTYPEALEYLYAHLPMFSRMGAAAIKEDLTNTLLLCQELGDPHLRFKSIHVAGTNGKGSTSHMLASVLQSAGYKTGLYTSPHLRDFRERIKINGQMVTEAYVTGFVERIKPHIPLIQPSFFEITVAMAFEYFAKEQVDIAVIETGLGGRLDSTNVITPELSVITNIGWDHMNILGNTLPEIAFEKAGIIKRAVPVVIGESNPETMPVFIEKAAAQGANIHFADKLHYVPEWQYQRHKLSLTVANRHNDERTQYMLDLPGYYQTHNVLTVLTALDLLRQLGWKIEQNAIVKGLSVTKKQTGLHGRWELISEHPDIILDVAHNEDGMKQLLEQLELAQFRELHLIIGMVKDKKIDAVLKLLPTTAHYYFTQAQIPRALPADQLAAQAGAFHLTGKTFSNVNLAIQEARSHAHKDDLILVCGSVFVVGEVQL